MHNYLSVFYGPRADYYTGVAEDLDEGKIRFNEGAFFFGMFWMAYRKMYRNTAITFVLIMSESALENWLIPKLSATIAYSLSSNVLIASLIGFIGSRLYINFARKQVGVVTQNQYVYTDPNAELIAQLRKEGGVSWTGPLMLLLICCAVIAVTFYLTILYN